MESGWMTEWTLLNVMNKLASGNNVEVFPCRLLGNSRSGLIEICKGAALQIT